MLLLPWVDYIPRIAFKPFGIETSNPMISMEQKSCIHLGSRKDGEKKEEEGEEDRDKEDPSFLFLHYHVVWPCTWQKRASSNVITCGKGEDLKRGGGDRDREVVKEPKSGVCVTYIVMLFGSQAYSKVTRPVSSFPKSS